MPKIPLPQCHAAWWDGRRVRRCPNASLTEKGSVRCQFHGPAGSLVTGPTSWAWPASNGSLEHFPNAQLSENTNERVEA